MADNAEREPTMDEVLASVRKIISEDSIENAPPPPDEPTMDEILASIRKIISEDSTESHPTAPPSSQPQSTFTPPEATIEEILESVRKYIFDADVSGSPANEAGDVSEASIVAGLVVSRNAQIALTSIRGEVDKLRSTINSLETVRSEYDASKSRIQRLEEEATALRSAQTKWVRDATFLKKIIDRQSEEGTRGVRFGKLWDAFFPGGQQAKFSEIEAQVRLRLFADVWFKLDRGEIGWTLRGVASYLHPDKVQSTMDKLIREEIAKSVFLIFE